MFFRNFGLWHVNTALGLAIRQSRSLRDVLTIMERVQERKAGFRSLTEAVDTTTPAGRMMMQMVGAFADYAECTIMRSRWSEVALWPAYKWLGTPHNSGVRLPTDTRVHAMGCEGLADEDSFPQARQAWLRTVKRDARFLQ